MRSGLKLRLTVFIYAIDVFVGAFLLFQVQPLMGKFILPWFGGSPDVWTTCMLFFQLFLLLGYLYAHLVVSHLPTRLQVIVHTILIIAAVATVKIIPDSAWKPTGTENPIIHIMTLLCICIGLPYFILSSTGPLMQGWFAKTVHGKSPYRLYSLSNAGSLLALLSYPFLIEPFLTRQFQAKTWSIGLGLFGFLTIWCAALLWRHGSSNKDIPDKSTSDNNEKITPGRLLLWMTLAAGSCIVLLAVTNKICQDITVIPFFWILPLSVYLLSFILCFHSERWYPRNFWVATFIISFVALVGATALTTEISAGPYIFIHTAALFACCMVFHGELYASRPHAKHLTAYYLMISLGGAIGGLFVVVIAPIIFNTYFELYVGLLMCCLVVLLNDKSGALGTRKRRLTWTALICVAGIAGFLMEDSKLGLQGNAIASERNFFGVLTVWEKEKDNPKKHHFVMQHGMTNHGLQFTDPAKHNLPTAYFGPTSGAGVAINNLPKKQNRRIGIVGLGVGTIAAYGQPGDHITYYEINPEVERQALKYFTYLSDCKGEVDVVLGDARLSLEALDNQNFDLLVLDAFTSDAIPVHLLTKEAFEIYFKHLNPDGLIALHISTNHVDLQSVVRRLAQHFQLKTAWIETHRDDTKGIFDSDWMLMTKDPELLTQKNIHQRTTPYQTIPKEINLWTDDHVNLFQVLK